MGLRHSSNSYRGRSGYSNSLRSRMGHLHSSYHIRQIQVHRKSVGLKALLGSFMGALQRLGGAPEVTKRLLVTNSRLSRRNTHGP